MGPSKWQPAVPRRGHCAAAAASPRAAAATAVAAEPAAPTTDGTAARQRTADASSQPAAGRTVAPQRGRAPKVAAAGGAAGKLARRCICGVPPPAYGRHNPWGLAGC